MKNCINMDYVKLAIDPTGAIEGYLWENLESYEFDSVESLISHLERNSAAHGSWPGMIYTRDILERYQDSQWVHDIEDCFNDYLDNVGEMPDFGKGFSLCNYVTFAVDWTASNLASRIRSYGKAYVVTYAIDSLDSNPARVAFLDESEMNDWVACNVSERVQHIVDHSAYSISEDELDAIQESELALVHIDTETL
jgi:hypothetical protein